MPSDQERPTLRLKNGATVDARSAYVEWRSLEGFNGNRPQEFLRLAEVARSGNSAVAPAELLDLRHLHREWFGDDGTLLSIVRDVVLSMFRETREGIVLVNPFQLTNESEHQLLVNIQAETDHLLRRLRRGENPFGHSIR